MPFLLRRLAIAGAALCAPVFLFILWYGITSIRHDFGMAAFLACCVGGMIALLSFASLVDTQAERLHRQWLDQHGQRRPE